MSNTGDTSTDGDKLEPAVKNKNSRNDVATERSASHNAIFLFILYI